MMSVLKTLLFALNLVGDVMLVMVGFTIAAAMEHMPPVFIAPAVYETEVAQPEPLQKPALFRNY